METGTFATEKLGLGARRPATLVVLGLALVLSGCVSARPWRDCLRPCTGEQLKKAEEVQVFKLDGTVARFDWIRWEEDDDGAFLVGGSLDRKGVRSAGERVGIGEICALRTRRVELGRVAANVILVPLALVAIGTVEVLAAKSGGEGPAEVDWEPPAEAPPPAYCTWLRRDAVAARE